MIKARIPACSASANLKSYESACKEFSWQDVEKKFSWHSPDNSMTRMNIITESIDRWADDSTRQHHNALIFSKGGETREYSYQALKTKSCQWANLLTKYGFTAGDRLIIMLPPCPETFFAMAACARMGVIFCPIFSSAGFYELEIRLESTAPKGILTLPDLVEKISFEFAGEIDHIFLTQGPAPGLFPNEIVISAMPDKMPSDFPAAMLSGDAPLYLIYTSGSTRPPKGVIHTHQEMTGMLAS
ncbi:MAG: AMP-binding protein, partial [Desulfobacterales bacterium]